MPKNAARCERNRQDGRINGQLVRRLAGKDIACKQYELRWTGKTGRAELDAQLCDPTRKW
jgi:hypothetical protein